MFVKCLQNWVKLLYRYSITLSLLLGVLVTAAMLVTRDTRQTVGITVFLPLQVTRAAPCADNDRMVIADVTESRRSPLTMQTEDFSVSLTGTAQPVAAALPGPKMTAESNHRDSTNDLALELRQIYTTRAERLLFIRAQSNVNVQDVIKVMDIASDSVPEIKLVLLTPGAEKEPCQIIRVPRVHPKLPDAQ